VKLAVLSPREASIFACMCDTVVAPEPALPAVRDTDAVASFDDLLARSPRVNRIALRVALHAGELAPRALGLGGRLRQLPEAGRARALEAAEHARSPQLRQLVKALKSLMFMSYYGDDRVMLGLGYDADARVARGRELRIKEARP
jgi:hypothetical protein